MGIWDIGCEINASEKKKKKNRSVAVVMKGKV